MDNKNENYIIKKNKYKPICNISNLLVKNENKKNIENIEINQFNL